jgi:hypothetical protein
MLEIFEKVAWQKMWESGVITVCLFSLSYGVYRAARWIGEHLVVPLRDAGLDHLRTVNGQMARQSDLLEENTATLRELKDAAREQQQASREQTAMLRVATNNMNGRSQ